MNVIIPLYWEILNFYVYVFKDIIENIIVQFHCYFDRKNIYKEESDNVASSFY